MDSEQKRKRKRIGRALYYSYSPPHYLSVRSLCLCFSFLVFLYLLSDRIPVARSAFRPVLVASSFPLLSTSSIPFHSNGRLFSSIPPPKIEDRVLFSDHLLLMVKSGNSWSRKSDELECVYYSNAIFSSDEIVSIKRDALSADEYDQFRSIVRCPLPPANYSAMANLKRRGRASVYLPYRDDLRRNWKVHSWETVAYAAALDGNTAVVFVKGLNLRRDRESDPSQFRCHFGLGNSERKERSVLVTKAIAAAQEVVRCSLPRVIRMSPEKAKGIRVTIGTKPHVHAKRNDHVLVPSVAKIFNANSGVLKNNTKYELCVCTMVWNQASALQEWITYHAWLGVERWFIYDNNSDDRIKDAIEELDLENYNVSRHVWPWIKTQEAGFSHCAIRARDECNWVGFFDVDEFFYFPFPSSSNERYRKLGFPGKNSLRNLVANFSASTIAEIRTSCHSFGPSGLSSPPSQGVTVGYTCRLQMPERHKSIVRPEALDITLLNVVHHFHLRKKFRYLNLPRSTAVINHYKYQVWESFRTKFFRRVATYVADWQENQNEGSRDRAPGLGTEAIEPPNWSLKFCEVWDTGLRDFILTNLSDRLTRLLPWERNQLKV